MISPVFNALKYVRTGWMGVLERRGFDRNVLPRLNIISAGNGHLRAEIPVSDHQTNVSGGTHGGWLSTIVDVSSSLAIYSYGYTGTGVSTDLSISFLRGSKPGHNLTIDARVLKVGNNLAYAKVDIFNGNAMIATGNHTKYIAGIGRVKNAPPH